MIERGMNMCPIAVGPTAGGIEPYGMIRGGGLAKEFLTAAHPQWLLDKGIVRGISNPFP
jgi:hypothetical protein